MEMRVNKMRGEDKGVLILLDLTLEELKEMAGEDEWHKTKNGKNLYEKFAQTIRVEARG